MIFFSKTKILYFFFFFNLLFFLKKIGTNYPDATRYLTSPSRSLTHSPPSAKRCAWRRVLAAPSMPDKQTRFWNRQRKKKVIHKIKKKIKIIDRNPQHNNKMKNIQLLPILLKPTRLHSKRVEEVLQHPKVHAYSRPLWKQKQTFC